MSDEADDLDVDLLVACHEGIMTSAGASPAASLPPRVTNEIVARVQQEMYCLELLESYRREGESVASEALRGTPALSHSAEHTMPADADGDPPIERLGRFKIISELGRGGHGIVFLAHDEALDRRIALKVPRPEALLSRSMRRRFVREAQAVARLAHPNLLTIYESGEDGPLCYLASAYCNGPTLAAWLERRTPGVPQRLAAEIVAALAEGVAYAHDRGVLHRDIKPGNVFLDANHGGCVPLDDDAAIKCVPKLGDFGLARLRDEADHATRTGALLGTPAYMAPEQARGDTKAIGVATDVYGLGTVLYELLAGEPPFSGNSDLEVLRKIERDAPSSLRARKANIARDLETICLKCLSKEPHQRYQSAAELSHDLHRFLAGEPITARRARLTERVTLWCRRNPAWAALLATLSFTLVGSTIFLSYSNLRIAAVLRSEQTSRRLLQEQLYAVDMRAADEAIRQHDPTQARLLLDRYAEGQERADLREFGWRYLRSQIVTPRTVLPQHAGDVYSISLSPTGDQIATAGRDGFVRVWERATQRLLQQFSWDGCEVNEVCFSPDGQWLASGGQDGRVRVWDTNTWIERHQFLVGGETTADLLGRDEVYTITVQPNGYIVGAGQQEGKSLDCTLFRFKPNGAIDLQFGTRGINSDASTQGKDCFSSLARAEDGSILAAGWTMPIKGRDLLVARFDSEGALDTTFGDQGVVRTNLSSGDDMAHALCVQPDGKIVVAGRALSDSSGIDLAVVRYLPNGLLDESFGTNGKRIVPVSPLADHAYVMTLQADGKYVVAGRTDVANPNNGRVFVARFEQDGQLDRGFGKDGISVIPLPGAEDHDSNDTPSSVLVRTDGRIVVACTTRRGTCHTLAIIRLASDGALDETFGEGGRRIATFGGKDEELCQAVFGPEGSLLICGHTQLDSGQEFAVLKLQSDGTPDRAFGKDGVVWIDFGKGRADARTLAVDADARILVAGVVDDLRGKLSDRNIALARLLPDGTLDRTFSSGGVTGLKFAPDSQRLFVSTDTLLYQCDLHAGTIAQRTFVPTGEIRDFDVSSDGEVVAVASKPNAYLWSQEDLGEHIQELVGGALGVRSICCLSDGRLTLLGTNSAVLRGYVRPSGDRTVDVDEQGGIIDLVQSSHDAALVVSTSGNVLRIRRTSDWELVATRANPTGRLWDAQFTRDSKELITSDADGRVVAWRIPSGERAVQSAGSRHLEAGQKQVGVIALSPDGRLVAMADLEGSARIADLESGRIIWGYESRAGALVALEFAENGQSIWMASSQGEVQAVQPARNMTLEKWSIARPVDLAAISPTQQRVALALVDKPMIVIAHTRGGREICRLAGPASVNRMEFHPRGDHLIVAHQGKLRVFDTLQGRLVAETGRSGESISDFAILPSGQLLVAEGHRGLALRTFPECEVISRWQVAGGGASSVAVESTGRNVAIVGVQGHNVQIWDRWIMQPVLTLDQHRVSSTPRSLQFTPRGDALVALGWYTDKAQQLPIWSAPQSTE